MITLPTAVNYPRFVDLRSDMEFVYDQTIRNLCQCAASCTALEVMADRQPAHKGKRFNREWLYYYAKMFSLGGAPGNNGASVEATAQALVTLGVPFLNSYTDNQDFNTEPPQDLKIEAALNKQINIATINYAYDDILMSIIHSVAMGIPVIAVMRVHDGFLSVSGPWRTHWWDTSNYQAAWAAEHVVVIVGYDLDTEMFLVENSWGPNYADGGFWGFHKSKFVGPDAVVTKLFTITNSQIRPVPTFQGATVLTPFESNAFINRVKTFMIANHLGPAFGGGNTQALVDKAIEIGISDKLLEEWAGQPRFFLKNNAASMGVDLKTLVMEKE